MPDISPSDGTLHPSAGELHGDRFSEFADPEVRAEIRRIALDIADLVKTISPFIEVHSSAVCPSCSMVCCSDRHSYYDRLDVIYMGAIGEQIPSGDAGGDGAVPCRFLCCAGCSLKRHLRPYRCTWFFCSPLLEHIETHTSRPEYRQFMGLLQRITRNRESLLNISGMLP